MVAPIQKHNRLTFELCSEVRNVSREGCWVIMRMVQLCNSTQNIHGYLKHHCVAATNFAREEVYKSSRNLLVSSQTYKYFRSPASGRNMTRRSFTCAVKRPSSVIIRNLLQTLQLLWIIHHQFSNYHTSSRLGQTKKRDRLCGHSDL